MKSKKRDIGGSEDIISHLPEEVICYILSFLPTKDVVSTSVLSKKWRHFFAVVPNLRFDNSFYFHHSVTKRERNEKIEGFTSFVYNVLVKQAEAKVPLKMFHLKCKDVDNDLVFDWIRRVLDRCVLDIDVSTFSPRDRASSLSLYYLPSEIFVSETLVKLKLDFVVAFNVSVEGDVSLPKLKTLHLDYFKIRTSMLNKLLSGCHILEELLLVNLIWDSKESSVIVSVPTLQRMTFCVYEDEAVLKMSMSFDNPNLTYFEYYDTIAAGYEKFRFDSLVEANLGLQRIQYQDKINLTNILIAICNVKILYLSDDTLKALACCCDTIPVFDNLVQLTIKTAQYVGWRSLPFLLKNCPVLETFVFEGLHHKYRNKCDEDGCLCQNQDEWSVKGDVDAGFSLSSIKVLKILNFGEISDDEEEINDQIEHVKNLLETVPNLEELILYYTTTLDHDEEDVMEVSEQLQMLPRIAAAKCNVKIISNKFNLSFTLFA